MRTNRFCADSIRDVSEAVSELHITLPNSSLVRTGQENKQTMHKEFLKSGDKRDNKSSIRMEEETICVTWWEKLRVAAKKIPRSRNQWLMRLWHTGVRKWKIKYCVFKTLTEPLFWLNLDANNFQNATHMHVVYRLVEYGSHRMTVHS